MARDLIRYESTPYDKAQHGGFVCTSWCTGSGEPAEVLERLLASPDGRCLVAHQVGRPSKLLGWAATALSRGRWAVAWAYTRDLFSREETARAVALGLDPPPARVRRRGLMTALLLEMGIDPAEPTPCLYWSPDAAAIAARGYRFIHAPKGFKEAA